MKTYSIYESDKVELSRKGNKIFLVISDDGEGSNILEAEKGVGITNIKSRAQFYHGSVTVVSKPGEGYELKVVLPLNGRT